MFELTVFLSGNRYTHSRAGRFDASCFSGDEEAYQFPRHTG